MTNKHNNWERIAELLEWLNVNVNRFATQIGIPRAENLYHIKKGNYGISKDLASRIVAHYPQVDRTWLLSGVGTMLQGQTPDKPQRIPFYSGYLENNGFATNKRAVNGNVVLPYRSDVEKVVRSMSPEMNDVSTVATDLFIRCVPIDEVIQGNEYVLELEDRVIWRKVRFTGASSKWRLVALNRPEFEDITIDRNEVVRAWRVVAKMAILES